MADRNDGALNPPEHLREQANPEPVGERAGGLGKKPYTVPKLVAYGAIAKLTTKPQSGADGTPAAKFAAS